MNFINNSPPYLGFKYLFTGIGLLASIFLLHILFNSPQNTNSTTISFFGMYMYINKIFKDLMVNNILIASKSDVHDKKITDDNMEFTLFSEEHNLRFSNAHELVCNEKV